jgi:hypothetical protein
MHLDIIPKWRKHQRYMRRTTCRHFIKCPCFTAPQNAHVTCPDRILISGGYIAVRSVMHLGMIPKWRKHKSYIRSIKLRPSIKCACSTAPHNVHAKCPDRVLSSGGYIAVRSVMHLRIIRIWRKHKKNIRSNKLRPLIKCACYTATQNVQAVCPDRIRNSSDDAAAR